jgi:hypothetical protein
MSEPKVGDRVRVVIEAKLSGQQLDWVLTDHGRYKVGNYGVTEIEVIHAPFVLPTKRWAQVSEFARHQFWTYSGVNEWRNLDGARLTNNELLERSGLRVISEGVKDE